MGFSGWKGKNETIGTTDSLEPSAKGCPGPYSAKGRWAGGFIVEALDTSAGTSVPYQAAVPGGRTEAGLVLGQDIRQTGKAGGSAPDGVQRGPPRP